MPRKVLITATETTDMSAIILVPDCFTNDDVLQWYRDNGATGEFQEGEPAGWEWGDVTDADLGDVVNGTIPEPKYRDTVMLHGFINLDVDGNLSRDSAQMTVSQEHADYDGEGLDGWNVWVRRDYSEDHPDHEKEPFTSIDGYEADFSSLEPAFLYADALAEKLKTEVDAY